MYLRKTQLTLAGTITANSDFTRTVTEEFFRENQEIIVRAISAVPMSVMEMNAI